MGLHASARAAALPPMRSVRPPLARRQRRSIAGMDYAAPRRRMLSEIATRAAERGLALDGRALEIGTGY